MQSQVSGPEPYDEWAIWSDVVYAGIESADLRALIDECRTQMYAAFNGPVRDSYVSP